jgi:hypothetical protein
MLTARDCTRIARAVPWASGLPRPLGARMMFRGPGPDGLFLVRIFLHGATGGIGAEGTTAESALCHALTGWGQVCGDPDARAKAFAVWQRLTN